MTDPLPRRDIEIRLFKREDTTYPVEITLSGEQVFRGVLTSAITSITTDGRCLFDTLFADATLRNAWAEARGRSTRRRVRLRIDPAAAELHTLPWEQLTDGNVVLAAHDDTPFSRYLPIGLPWGRPITTRPVRALIVISNPADLHSKYDLPQADVALEEEILDEALSGIGANDLQVEYLDEPVTLERLEEALRRGYHLLHFLGHGAFNTRRGQAALYLQNDDGNAQRVIDQDLAAMLARQGVQPHLVFLAACQSATRSSADAYLGLAPKLVAAGVPAVVAMQDRVTVASARKFSAAFYRRLLEHGSVDVAINEARSTLLTAGRADAAVPVLFMRLTSGRLWSEESSSTQVAPTAPRIPPPPEPTPLPEVKSFIGREAELMRYAQQLRTDHLAVITGSPDIGKSALAVKLARAVGGDAAHIFWHEFHVGEGLEEVSSRLAGFLYWLDHTDTWNLLSSARLTGAQPLAPRDVLDYAAQGLRAQSLRGRECVVILDAWQMLSTDDQAILSRCVERLANEHTRVIITSHSTPSFSRPLDPLPLNGLTLAETQKLLAEQAVSLSPDLIRDLHARTGGNPQFLLLACDALRQTSDPQRMIGRLAEADQVERFLMAEVDHGLSDQERRMMSGVAALLGYPGTRDAIEAALDADGLRRPLSGLSGRHLLTTHDGAHGKEYGQVALLQAFYYGLLGRRERLPIHQRAGIYYEQDEPEPLRAAQHFFQIGEHDRAARLITANVAAVINRGQARTLRQVLDQIDVARVSATQRVEIELARGRVAAHLGDVAAARSCYAAALHAVQTLPDSIEAQALKASICRWLADLLHRHGEYPAALEAVQNGLDALADRAGSEAAELRLIAAETYSRLGDLDRTRAMAEQVRQWGESVTQPTALARAYNLIGLTEFRRGAHAAALEQYQRALELYRQTHHLIGEAKTYNLIGASYLSQSRWTEAEAMFREAHELSTRVGDAFLSAVVGSNLGLLLLRRGQLAEARSIYQTALDLLTATQGSLYVRASVQLNLAVALLYQGEAASARDNLQASRALFEQTQARDQLSQLYVHLAEAALALGDVTTAEQEAQQALTLARELQQREGEGVAQRALGEVAVAQGQSAAAKELLQDSARTLQAVQDEYEEAYTYLILAELYTATQRTAEAQAALDRCVPVFEQLGAAQWLARASEAQGRL